MIGDSAVAGRQQGTFDDIAVYPYRAILNQPLPFPGTTGGPAYPEFKTCTWERHCSNGRACDNDPFLPEPVTDHLAGTWWWCGPVLRAFSHQFADCSHRLPLGQIDGIDGLLFGGATATQVRQHQELPRFVLEALEYLGLAGMRHQVLWEPTIVERIVVIGQGSQLQVPPTPEYARGLTEIQGRTWPSQGSGDPVYLSRAGLARGRLVGEPYLETLMADAGVRVLRPEQIRLDELYGAVVQANHVLISEGGVVHGLELLGAIPGDVTMIARRAKPMPGDGFAQGRSNIEASLSARVRGRLSIIDATRSHMGFTAPEQTAYGPNSMALLDPQSLIDQLESVGVRVGKLFNLDEFLACADADLLVYRQSFFTRSQESNPDFAEREARVNHEFSVWRNELVGRAP